MGQSPILHSEKTLPRGFNHQAYRLEKDIMGHPYHHAISSAKKFGGKPEDYQPIHDWFDATKELAADVRHRILRHHSQGIFECERTFGTAILNSDDKHVPVRLIGEQHVKEDFGFIPSFEHWMKEIRLAPWMTKGTLKLSERIEDGTHQRIEG
jgi:hypothetical protein